ncbi:MAG: PilZ domain-containing protein [Thermodesulfobacteriota bacterium]
MGKEQRTTPRFDFGLKVVILKGGEAYFTKDISLRGCFLPACRVFALNDKVDLVIDVPGFGYVFVTGEARHLANGGTGIMFLSFKDLKAKEAMEEFLNVVSLCEESSEDNGLRWLDA